MESKKCDPADRTVYFDYLRIFATFAVMILHISAQNWYISDVNGIDWQVFNFSDSIVRWGVPIFMMISGALFLSREIPLKKMYSKYILRMAISFLIWSIIYAIFVDGDIMYRFFSIVQGHYHMWFVLMIIGIYMCMPFIKPIVTNNAKIKYYLLLALIFAFIVPEIITLANDFGNELVIKCASALNAVVTDMYMHMVLGCVSYFVLGFYLNKIELNKRQRVIPDSVDLIPLIHR